MQRKQNHVCLASVQGLGQTIRFGQMIGGVYCKLPVSCWLESASLVCGWSWLQWIGSQCMSGFWVLLVPNPAFIPT